MLVKDRLAARYDVPISFQKDTLSQKSSSYARRDISCNDPAEKQYYLCKKFDLICCRYGSTEPDASVNEEMKHRYKVPVRKRAPSLLSQHRTR